MELILDFNDPKQRQTAKHLLSGLKGQWRLELTRSQAGRSLRANAYYHGVIVEYWRAYMAENDERFDHDAAHESLKAECNAVTTVDRRTGTLVRRPASTADLSVEDFGAYIERCIAHLAGFGIVIPEPSSVGLVEERKKVTA